MKGSPEINEEDQPNLVKYENSPVIEPTPRNKHSKPKLLMKSEKKICSDGEVEPKPIQIEEIKLEQPVIQARENPPV